MYTRAHGGLCCGITHLLECYGTDADVHAVEDAAKKLQEAQQYVSYPECILKEIVLTNKQMRACPNVLFAMKRAGFVRVARWKNSNSGNVCNMFLLYAEPASKPVPY